MKRAPMDVVYELTIKDAYSGGIVSQHEFGNYPTEEDIEYYMERAVLSEIADGEDEVYLCAGISKLYYYSNRDVS
jgi:hypothetical protein